MTPPGEPLQFLKGPRIHRDLAGYQKQGFDGLEDQIDASIAEANPRAVLRLWHKTTKGRRVMRGCKVSVEAKDIHGRTSLFEAFYIEGNDERHVIQVTQGSFASSDVERFRNDHDGISEVKGAKP